MDYAKVGAKIKKIDGDTSLKELDDILLAMYTCYTLTFDQDKNDSPDQEYGHIETSPSRRDKKEFGIYKTQEQKWEKLKEALKHMLNRSDLLVSEKAGELRRRISLRKRELQSWERELDDLVDC